MRKYITASENSTKPKTVPKKNIIKTLFLLIFFSTVICTEDFHIPTKTF